MPGKFYPFGSLRDDKWPRGRRRRRLARCLHGGAGGEASTYTRNSHANSRIHAHGKETRRTLWPHRRHESRADDDTPPGRCPRHAADGHAGSRPAGGPVVRDQQRNAQSRGASGGPERVPRLLRRRKQGMGIRERYRLARGGPGEDPRTLQAGLEGLLRRRGRESRRWPGRSRGSHSSASMHPRCTI